MKWISYLLVAVGLIVFVSIFFPVAREETNYSVNQILNLKPDLTPPNKDFSIVIQKIAAVAPIIANVDYTDSKKYLPALKKGVAQAKNTALPGQKGNFYLFAHSTDAFYDVSRYNAVFYLIGKLDKGDIVTVYYQGKEYDYEVYDKRIVNPDATEFLKTLTGNLNPSSSDQTLTLQTCYPPGTTIKRLVILAKLLSVK